VGASAIARDAIVGANIVDGSVTMGDRRDPPKAASAQSIAAVAFTAPPATIVAVDIVVPPSVSDDPPRLMHCAVGKPQHVGEGLWIAQQRDHGWIVGSTM
jgi:hypothetical protein